MSSFVGMALLFAADNLLPIVASSVLGIVVLIVAVWYIGGKKRKEAEKSPEPYEGDEAVEDSTAVEERRPKKAPKQFTRKPSYSHALLAATLKGHTGQILDTDFDSRGKYLLSCSEGSVTTLACAGLTVHALTCIQPAHYNCIDSVVRLFGYSELYNIILLIQLKTL